MSIQSALVIGAGSGVGEATAGALTAAGTRVLAAGRERDATDPAQVAALIAEADPDLVVVAAGTRPRMAAIEEQSWESFSAPWNVDVRIAFEVGRAALARPLRPGSTVLIVSSGAGTRRLAAVRRLRGRQADADVPGADTCSASRTPAASGSGSSHSRRASSWPAPRSRRPRPPRTARRTGSRSTRSWTGASRCRSTPPGSRARSSRSPSAKRRDAMLLTVTGTGVEAIQRSRGRGYGTGDPGGPGWAGWGAS